MEVEITGSSTANFNVAITDQAGRHEYDIKQLLEIKQHAIEAEVQDCAANEHFWRQVAVDAAADLKQFEEIDWAQYQAHTDRVARYYLRGIGDKNPTLTDKKTAAVLIFSSGTKMDAAVCQAAYNGYCVECKSVGLTPVSRENFITETIYCSEHDYEDWKARLLSLELRAERLKTIASAFNEKSWAVKTLAANERAKITAHI